MSQNAVSNSLKRFFSRNTILWLIIMIYPFLFLWQGLNFSDEGNALTIYQLIFSNPQSISDTFGAWGANVFGGLWLLIFGGFGLIGARFAGALISVLTVVIAYFILREHIERKILLLGFLISFLFSYHFLTLTIVGYNNLSVLFFVLAIFFLSSGLKKDDNALIFLAGLILSLNIFVRLPNVLGLLFFLAIPFSAHIKNTPLKAHLKQYFVFTAGALLGFAVAFFAMKTLGHFDYYVESLRYLIGATQINHGPYSDGVLLTALAGYFRLFFDAAVMFFLAVSAIFLYLVLKFDRINFFIKLFLLAVFSAILYAKYDFIGVPIGGRVASLLTGLCYAVFAVRVLNYKKGDNNLSIVVLLMLILFVIIPLGSGAGFVNSLYIIPVAFPIVFSYIRNFQKTDFSPWMSRQKIFQNISLAVNDGTLEKVKVFLLAAFILYALANAFAFSYDDSYNRFSLNAGIDHKYLKGIYTTKEKAASLNELILELPKYVQGGDTLLVAWIAPMIYYLTETKPYFPHPWTEIYARDQIVEFLGGGRKNGELPVVIRYNYSKKHEYDDILYEFLGENSYEKKWNNDVYEIYAPNL